MDKGCIVDRLIDGDDLGAHVGKLLHRRDQRLRIGRHDGGNGRLGGGHGIDDRDLAVGSKLIRSGHRQGKAEFLGLCLRAALQCLIEGAALNAEHQRDVAAGLSMGLRGD